MTAPRILVNLFHPNLSSSRGNKRVAEKISELTNLTLRDIYSECPDSKFDIKKEQELLLDHDLIVFQHPFYWYSSPAFFKEWQDQVLEMGFAYPPGKGDKLNGKYWLTILTTGGPKKSYRSGGYNQFTISELLRPFQQTANLCGMQWLTPLVINSVLPEGVGGVNNSSNSDLTAFAQTCSDFLQDFQID